jgi:HSP20 family protein
VTQALTATEARHGIHDEAVSAAGLGRRCCGRPMMRSDRQPPAGRTRRSVTVRYQRLTYRRGVVVTGGQLLPIGEGWRSVAPAAVLAEPRWRPRADVTETPTTIAVSVELAGIDPDEIEAVLYDDALIVSGRRQLAGPGAGGVYLAAEISQGSFRLEIGLPVAVAPEPIEARYERGLLELTLAKADGAGNGR